MKAYSKLMGVVVVMTILVSAISLPFFALAQDYTLLEKSVLPAGQASDGKVDFATYIESGFKTFLAVVVIIAIVMLTASGLQYITAGSGGGKGEAKNRAMAALLGLLIALSAYLILRTINPDLVNINFSLDRVGQSMNSGPSAPTGTSGTTRPDSQNPGTGNGNAGPGAVLSGSVPAQSDCHEASNTECVSLNEAGATVANGYSGINGPGRTDRVHRDVAEATVWVQQNLNSDHNLSTQITAAHTEGVGHSAGSEHYEGRAVDIQPTGGNVTSSNLNIIADYCRQAGFTYVLVENRHVHCDAR